MEVNTRCAEVGLEEMAEDMNVDPIDLRLANLLPLIVEQLQDLELHPMV